MAHPGRLAHLRHRNLTVTALAGDSHNAVWELSTRPWRSIVPNPNFSWKHTSAARPSAGPRGVHTDPTDGSVRIDAIVLKVRAGQVGNRPVYVAMGISLDGHRDVLGMWIGPTGGEGAKQWMNMLTELRNRGILDVMIVCCDGLKGLPESIVATWPNATVQTCVVHLVRNSLRFASKKYWKRSPAG